jgi:hypothetical protein
MYRTQPGLRQADIYSIMVGPRPVGATIGVYRGLPIAERVVDQFNRRFTFAGVIGRRRDGQYDVDALKPGQFVVEPGLVYDLETGQGRQRQEPRTEPRPVPQAEAQKVEDKRVLIQVSATLALFLTSALAIQLLLRIFHAG